MNRKSQNIKPITALYCRLSIDDGRDNESMSISNQKAVLKDYAEKNGIYDYDFYVDDGYTGRNFNRPSFQRMIADIESGRVCCVITKDLSRLGRNYIEAGGYIEVFFPRNKVRYIAINDGVDSLNQNEMDITPFKNILNDLYSRDISKKVLAGIMSRSRQGKFCGGPTPYGLTRDPADRGHLIIDPETAPNVELIYNLAQKGLGYMRIAKYLQEHKIPITRCKTTINLDVNYYSWSRSVLSKMLRNPVYRGAHVVCKTHQKGIRSNTYNKIPRDEWEVIENCHEAIISKEQWNRVQMILDCRPPIMQESSSPFYNLFHGLIYCDTCGKSMALKYEKAGRTDIDRVTKKRREPIDKAYYVCNTYSRLGKKSCTSHKVEARDLYNLVLADIQEHAKTALQDTKAFYYSLTKRLEEKYCADEGAMNKELDALTQRNHEIDTLFMNLYEDKSKGILNEQRFCKMTETLDQEQIDNKARIGELLETLRAIGGKNEKIGLFIEEIQKYTTVEKLDEELLNRLINRIMIGDVQKVDGEKIQEIKVFYNFVGEIPG